MLIQQDFLYDADYEQIADEFCKNDSEYQAEVLNSIGLQFKIWSQDRTKTMTYVQLLEIAEQLNDNGKWFVNILHEYMTEEGSKE